jgi:hypothetical protein
MVAYMDNKTGANKMTQKHTSGPWAVTGESYGNYVRVAAMPYKGSLRKRTVAQIPWGDWDSENAHLIAAAPDLLEALECLEDAGYLDGIYEITREKCLKAIKKAKGE